MTAQRPDTGDPSAQDDPSSAPGPEGQEGESPSEPEAFEADPATGNVDQDDGSTLSEEALEPGAEALEPGEEVELESAEAEAVAASPAWTTTPVAPDPVATEAALAALAARPETTLEPPEGPPPVGADDGGPPDEGTPLLLVGGILVGAFLVALAIVFILFRPFDSGAGPDASLSPSPFASGSPVASPTAEASVDTPNFVGLSLEDAELTAEDYGLVLRVIPVETDDADPETILDQDPEPGSAVPPGTTVELSVAFAVSTVAVPDLVDVPEDEAIELLEDAGLEAGERSEAASDTVAAGNLVSSDPEAAEEVAPGSEVDYVVSSGPQTVAVPDLVDVPEDEAIELLEDAGLEAGERSEAASDTIAAGNLVSSDPEAAEEVAPGSEVDYVVSSGPQTVAVPDLVDVPEDEAIELLEDAGLEAGERSEAASDTIAAGNLVSSDPEAAEEVAPGSEVDYVVSTGPQTVAVPDLVDVPEDEAIELLEDAGLEAGERSEAASDTIAAGNLVSSDPEAAEEVAPGSEVDYVVSSGPQTVAVPDLVDVPEDEAIELLEDAGLEAGERSEAASDTIAAGNLVSSDPEAAEEVAPGSEVDYVVSSGPQTVETPTLVGLTLDEAEALADEAGVLLSVERVATSEFEPDTVIEQDPEAGTALEPGSTVSLVVAEAPVAVPDLVDVPEDEAIELLEDAGLEAGERSEAASDTIAAGNLVSSDPEAAEEVGPGSEVDYVVSSGPQTVAVPDLVGLALEEAQTSADEAGLLLILTNIATTESEPGTVIAQDPEAETAVEPGSTVDLTVAEAPEPVSVPDLVGESEADAIAALEAAGLSAGERSEAFSDTIATGDLTSTTPAAGAEVAPGSAIDYVVSLGVEPVSVPDLVGESEADAIAALEAAGLSAGERSEAFSDTIATGDLTSTTPAAGAEVAPGSAIDYVVSLGVEPVSVPDLVGESEADAIAALEAAGLSAGERSEAFSDTIATGDLTSTTPAAGAEVAPGSAIDYVVSLGVEPVSVPDLVGESEADAIAALEAAGLSAGERSEAFSDTIATGDLTSTTPAAGAEVAPGSAIDYVVSLGVEPVSVPDLVGESEADAIAALEAAGLSAGERSEAFSDTIATGDLTSTTPAAGAEVAPGSAIDYVVSLGVEPVSVPDLVGESEADAIAALEAAGLSAGERSEAFSDTIATGDLTSTTPAAGAEVAPGSAIDYVVSLGVEPVSVPDLVGESEADAIAALEAAGLSAGERSEAFSDTIATGDLTSTTPAAGAEVAPGSAIDYVVSLGVEPVSVPDLVGESEADAIAALEAAGLSAGERSEAFSDTIATGDLTSTTPAAGAEVAPGSAIDYVVSLGVEPVSVPDLVGESEADAIAALEAAGLSAGERSEAFSDTIATGDLTSTTPAAGAEVAPGSAIDYVVSLGVEPVSVPDLVGESEADAIAALEAAGLSAGERSEAFSDTIATGDLTSTTPAAGAEVAPGSAIDYVVSLGVEPVSVPDLVGESEADAIAALEAAGLSAGERSEAFSDTIATGDLTSTTPAAGAEVAPGSAIDYVVSTGPAPIVIVPNVRNMSADQAVAAIEAAGLSVGEIIEEPNGRVAAGDVIKTEPQADGDIPLGTSLALYVSTGPAPIVVPDVVGLPRGQARDAIEAAGLVLGDVEEVSDAADANTVLSQDPAPGTEVETGSAVALTVSSGPSQVAIPDVRGLPEDDAVAAIEDAGLVVAETLRRDNVDVPEGDAIRTEPEAGTDVDPGSGVTLFISRGPAPIVVPDVVGLPRGQARDAIEAAGLVLGDVEEVSDAADANTVLSQDPAPGTEVETGSAVALTVSSGPSQVAIPDVRGLPEDDAVAAIEDAGLVVAETLRRDNVDVPEGDAIRTEPEAGTDVDPGSGVTLFISRGPAPIVVPDVVGLPRGQARDAIEAAGLVLGDVEEVSDAADANTVLSQDPAPGTEVETGSAVALTVSSGPSQVAIPDVRGLPEDDAVAAIEDAGLVVAETLRRDNVDVPEGDAIRTEPEAGTDVDPGSGVTLFISRGPAPIVVPDVVGLPRGQARDAIEAAGLVLGDVEEVSDAADANTVLSQDPAPGTEVETGSAVALTVSSGPSQVAIPDVRGLPEDDAVAAIEDAGLVVAETLRRDNVDVPEGDAIRTEPEAGTDVDPGSGVTLFISRGPAPIVVPDVVGLPRGQARDAIEAAGLVLGDVEEVSDAADANTVLSQDPAPGTEVETGSAVALTVSSGPSQVAIPDVRGLPEDDAVAAIEDAGLVVAETLRRDNVDVPEGDAIRTEPEAGTDVDPGSGVTLFISRGPAPIVVPDVVGLPRGQARDAIEAAGLVLGDVEEVSDAADANTVLSQDPAPGTEVETGSAVALTVSSGPSQVAIPDVRGLPEDDAVAAIEDAGLVVAETLRRDNVDVPEGDAIRTEPEAGTDVDPGSGVTLFISRGPAPIVVPDVVGLPRGQARDAIEAAGLVLGDVEEVSDAADANTVLSQDPAPGTEVETGSAVALTVSSGPSQVAIPDVRGLPEDDAVAAIEDAGLVVAETLRRDNVDVPEGDAIRTEPEAGTDVDPGSGVTLFISRGPAPIVVPDVTGLTEDEALAALADAGLEAGDRSEADDPSDEGTVISTDSSAGSEVPSGSAVAYTVSSGPQVPSVGEGGTLDDPGISSTLDDVAAGVVVARGLDIGNTPYDATSPADQRALLAQRASLIHDPSTLAEEETALKRMGLLGSGDDLTALLEELYGQPIPVAYAEQDGHLSVRNNLDSLNAANRTVAARELARAAVDQAFGLDAVRVDPADGDAALAGVALEQGDATLTMISWADAAEVEGSTVNNVVVPGDDELLASMPQLLQREYTFPFLEGRAFAGSLRDGDDWSPVDAAWSDPPRSTEQVMHPGRYPDDEPVAIGLGDIAGSLGDGWSEGWQQTMGELRTGVWLADGEPGAQENARSPVDLPKAGAAAGWAGDRLVSLDGPGDSWAIVWQTAWDSADDVGPFANNAEAAFEDLPGAHAVVRTDISGDASEPLLVLLTSDGDTLAAVQAALGVGD